MSEQSTSSSGSCGLTECFQVCPSNVTDFQSTYNCESSAREEGVVTLKFLVGDFGAWITPVAKRFSAERPDVNVEIVVVPLAELSPNVINEARSKTGLFDGFVTPPGVMGSIVEEDGWADLKPYIEQSVENTKDWSDIMLSYRKWIAQYQDQILMFPLDGDVLSLFYRKDVLDAFNLKVPRTWDEFNKVAAATHGKVFRNQTLTGTCIGRVVGCAGSYWANLILSSMTQAAGTSSGHLFDSSDMKPLLGEALQEALLIMENQAKYGPPDELGDCVGLNDRINQGSCVMTYNWGNTFAVHMKENSIFQTPGIEIGVAPTPGSTRILDRETMKLVPCEKETCPFGTDYEDIGIVNSAPYLAFGGWSCAVNNYTTPGKKQLATEFCAYAASGAESNKLVVANATTRDAGADPFRSSHLDVDLWVADGYSRSSVEEYFATIGNALGSDNCVTDIRFPTSSTIYAMLDREFYDYLSRAANENMTDTESLNLRKEICDRLQMTFSETIAEYDSQASTRSSALLQYQKLRNVFSVKIEQNQLGPAIRAYGFAMATLTLGTAVACGLWTYRNRHSPVVKASQPFFLILISVGVFVFGASIFPMAIDDGHSSLEACNRACMAVPWLATLGWSILFSALYAKIRRVNLVIKNAMNFRSVQVSERDVMTPFATLFTSNLVLLMVWTIFDPLFWERRQINETESYGICTADPDSLAWRIILTLLCIFNGAALIGANWEAWKARKVDTEYGESSFIGLIMGSMLQVVIVGVPLSFLVNDNPTARFFVSSSMAFVVSMSVLVLLFLPKFIKFDSKMTRITGSRIKTEIGSSGRVDQTSMINTVREKVENLEAILREAGIECSQYIEQAGLRDLDFSKKSDVPSILSRDPSDEVENSWREPSLPPVAEEDELDDSARTEEPKQATPQATLEEAPRAPTRSSVSRWLQRKKEQNGSSAGSGSDSTGVDMSGSLSSSQNFSIFSNEPKTPSDQ